MKRQFLLSSLILLIYTSCEKVLEVELPQEEPLITINSIFNADSILTVNLTKSRPSGSRSNNFEKIENAEVELYKNNLKVAPLKYDGKGIYRLTSLVAVEPGAFYSVRVNSPGFKTVVAEEIMPTKPFISSFNKLDLIETDFTYREFNLTLTLEDKPESNFFLIKAYLVTPGNKSHFEIQMNNVLSQFSPTNVSGSYMFTDNLFNGKAVKLELTGSLFITDVPHSIIIEVASISKNYYDYEYSVKKQLNSEPLFGQEYIPIPNNVKNGLGLFGTLNSSSFSFQVKK